LPRVDIIVILVVVAAEDSENVVMDAVVGIIFILIGPALLIAHFFFDVGGLGMRLAGTLVTCFFVGLGLVLSGFEDVDPAPRVGCVGLTIWALGIYLVGSTAKTMISSPESPWRDVWTVTMVFGALLGACSLVAAFVVKSSSATEPPATTAPASSVDVSPNATVPTEADQRTRRALNRYEHVSLWLTGIAVLVAIAAFINDLVR